MARGVGEQHRCTMNPHKWEVLLGLTKHAIAINQSMKIWGGNKWW